MSAATLPTVSTITAFVVTPQVSADLCRKGKIDTATLTFRAWDGTTGTAAGTANLAAATAVGAATAYSKNTRLATVLVNDAPTLMA
jgi:hypothetical protein